jgi:hypothetical protein
MDIEGIAADWVDEGVSSSEDDVPELYDYVTDSSSGYDEADSSDDELTCRRVRRLFEMAHMVTRIMFNHPDVTVWGFTYEELYDGYLHIIKMYPDKMFEFVVLGVEVHGQRLMRMWTSITSEFYSGEQAGSSK